MKKSIMLGLILAMASLIGCVHPRDLEAIAPTATHVHPR